MSTNLPGTESDSPFDHLETRSTAELLQDMNSLDKTVPDAVEAALPQLEVLVDVVVRQLQGDGRLFYVGAGTSGRLGIVDASECPPTFGVAPDQVIGLIAGGDSAIRQAVEGAEDDPEQGFRDLQQRQVSRQDVVVGLSASGTAPYVLGALRGCRLAGIPTGCITCNTQTPLAELADYPVEVVTGPEFVTGSTRLKAGTAQKLILNMLSTVSMIRLGRVKGNKMVDMQLSNHKLLERGVRYVMAATGLGEAAARQLLDNSGSVRAAIHHYFAQP